jgi:hypothetical protein
MGDSFERLGDLGIVCRITGQEGAYAVTSRAARVPLPTLVAADPARGRVLSCA